MKVKLNQILIAALIYVAVCFIASAATHPFSITSFIGPAAGIASALVILWGGHVFFGLLLGTLIFNAVLTNYFDVSIDIAISLIGLLAICLQAYWCKLLTQVAVNKHRWLESRAQLFIFILQIGPVAGCVSAAAAVLVSVLDVKGFDVSLNYAFATSWSGSVLVSVFLIPTLLFTQKSQTVILTKRRLVVVSPVLWLNLTLPPKVPASL